MPAPTALFNYAALAQSIVTIVVGAVVGWYGTRYWKRDDARRTADAATAAALKTRNETADAERQQLMDDSKANKEQHTDLRNTDQKTHEQVQQIAGKVHALEVAIGQHATRDTATREYLDRIDKQLTLLLQNILKRA